MDIIKLIELIAGAIILKGNINGIWSYFAFLRKLTFPPSHHCIVSGCGVEWLVGKGSEAAVVRQSTMTLIRPVPALSPPERDGTGPLE